MTTSNSLLHGQNPPLPFVLFVYAGNVSKSFYGVMKVLRFHERCCSGTAMELPGFHELKNINMPAVKLKLTKNAANGRCPPKIFPLSSNFHALIGFFEVWIWIWLICDAHLCLRGFHLSVCVGLHTCCLPLQECMARGQLSRASFFIFSKSLQDPARARLVLINSFFQMRV